MPPLNDQQRSRVEQLRQARFIERSRRMAQQIAQEQIRVEQPQEEPDNREIEIEFAGIAAPTGLVRPTGWWQMRNKRWILINEMGEQHLQNVINLVGRRNRNSDLYNELITEQRRRFEQQHMMDELQRRQRQFEGMIEWVNIRRQRQWGAPLQEPEEQPIVVDPNKPRRIKK